jgi:hypothetical protein
MVNKVFPVFNHNAMKDVMNVNTKDKAKVVPLHAINAYGDWSYSSTHS